MDEPIGYALLVIVVMVLATVAWAFFGKEVDDADGV